MNTGTIKLIRTRDPADERSLHLPSKVTAYVRVSQPVPFPSPILEHSRSNTVRERKLFHTVLDRKPLEVPLVRNKTRKSDTTNCLLNQEIPLRR